LGRCGRKAQLYASVIDPPAPKRAARLCSRLFFAAFPIVLVAVIVAWLVHPEHQR
jgi:hypothetical protein